VKPTSPSSHPSTSSIAHRPLALVNARLIDPAAQRELIGGVLVVDGLIREAGAAVVPANLPAHAQIIDCGGDCVAPGLIDMRAFIGEPGAEHRETIATATLAATSRRSLIFCCAARGILAVCGCCLRRP
jgi:dihydroorotase